MSPPDPTDQSKWHLENWQQPGSWATCERCGILILKSHLADGVCRDEVACDARRLELENRDGKVSDPKCPWCGEHHPTELIRLHGDLATTCPRLGAHEAVMVSRPDLVAMQLGPLLDAAVKIKGLGLPETEDEIAALEAQFAHEGAVELPARLSAPPDFLRTRKPDLVAMARTPDGSPIVAFAPSGLEVRAFGIDDLDARGMPRWKP